MRKTFFLPIAEALAWPESEIGHLAYHLGKLMSTNVPIVPGLVVPRRTLELITQQNHLDHALQQWFQTVYLNHIIPESEAHKALLTLFTHLHIDSEISSQFIEQYYQVANHEKVNWTASWVTAEYYHLSVASETVKGEANVFDLLLETWCQTVWTALLNTPALTSLNLGLIVPAGLLLQTYSQPSISGWVMTSVPDEAKSLYGVYLEHTPEKPTYLVDVRTWHILKHEKGDTRTGHEGILPAQALEAAQFANRVKLHDFHHLKVSWAIIHQKVVITNVERLQVVGTHELASAPSPALLLGQAVVRGQATAEVKVLKQQPAPRSSFAGQILVLPELLTISLSNLKDLKGVIVDHFISLKAQSLLRAHHIPTLSHAKTATRKLKASQVIVLNTFEGRVSIAAQVAPVAAQKSSRRTGLMAVISNLSQLQTTDLSVAQALYIDGTQIWSQLSEHPQHILRTTAQLQIKNHLQHVLTSLPIRKPIFYRPVTLTSAQQLKLNHASAYVNREENPQLGYFGAVQLLQQPHTLALEISALAHSVAKEPDTSLILPLTRTPAELTRLVGFVKNQTKAPLKVCWELNFPENIWNLKAYPLKEIDQVIVNVPQLYSLSLGIDLAEAELAAYYLFDPDLLKQMLAVITQVVPAQKLWLQTLPKAYQAMSQVAAEHSLAGVIGPISDLATIHHQLQIAEYHWLMNRKTLH